MTDPRFEPSGEQPAGEVELIARITIASNATFYARIGDTAVVYKPIDGERPLWDFPDATLAHREVAAYLVSEALGWNVVPRTWLGEGPLGPGMLQLWQEVEADRSAVDVVPSDAVPESWRRVFDGVDDDEHPVALVHEDSPALRRMAIFDVITNNADRKGGHVLAMPDGHRFGVDHGLTFHPEHKLRTVLWGWIGEDLGPAELTALDHVRAGLDGELGQSLAQLLTAEEREAFAKRIDRLRRAARFPGPRGEFPSMPWPLF